MRRLNTYILFLGALSLALSFGSCNKCAKKIGGVTEKNIQLGQFHSINIDGAFVVQIKQDSSFTLRLKGGEGILENVRHEIVSDTLRVFNENTCNFLSDYSKNIVLEIGCGSLQKIALRNPKEVKDCKGLSSDQLLLEIRNCGVNATFEGDFKKLMLQTFTGTPTINLKGNADEFVVDENTFGHIYAFDLITSKTWVKTQGTGYIHVNATDELHALHTGSGIIRYRGNPKKVVTEIAPHSSAQIIAD
ncbi:MAG: hypothetical protein CL840_13420 [Crocinitomicaceae bacterium]|nr:hypothetical protein [Crocinitomicaceae bacterium]|tara:strand:+ start:7784 stop:8524 length:741 start_codon:yes stop_codon:yes gene_type:complete